MNSASRNTFSVNGWTLEKLVHHSDIENFDCGDRDLNEYFRVDSVAYQSELMTQTYCFHQEGDRQCNSLALVDFCNDSISRNFIPNRDKRKINYRKRGYHSYPALKITRLGVHVEAHGKNIGSTLLYMIKLFFLFDNRSGCRFLTVDAYRNAQGFYEKNLFVPMLAQEDDNPATPTVAMFFDLKSVDVRNSMNENR